MGGGEGVVTPWVLRREEIKNVFIFLKRRRDGE